MSLEKKIKNDSLRPLPKKRLSKKAKDSLQVFPKDSKKLIHELQENKAKLKAAKQRLINEITERKRAEKRVRETQERVEWLGRFPQENPNPVLRVSADGTVLYRNPATTRAPGWACDGGQPLPIQLQQLVARAIADGREVQEDLELSGRFYWAWVSPPRGGYVNVYGRDITNRMGAEAGLRLSMERLRLALDASNSGAWEWDLRSNENVWSEELWKVYGLKPHSCKPSYEAWRQTIISDDRAKAEHAVQEAARKGTELNAEWRVHSLDGTERWLMSRGRPLHDADGQVVRFVGIVTDITERKRAEMTLQDLTSELQQLNQTLEQRIQARTKELKQSQERLRQLASQLLMAQEKERKRIAVELHDSLLSELAAMKYLFEAKIKSLMKGKRADSSEFNNIVDIMQRAIRDTREIMNNLHPPILDELGLIPTIDWLLQGYQKTYEHIQVRKQVAVFEQDIPTEKKMVIFRVLQEALNNFARHGNGNLVEVALLKSGNTLQLNIQDNGQGFDVKKVQKGVGLESMRERVEISGGSFLIGSGKGKGTTITTSWSLGGDG